MADDSKKDSQSVDDIVDGIADDMGVEDRKVPTDSKDDAVASLGGVFDIPSSSKRRKKKKKKKSSTKESAKESASVETDEKPLSKKERLRKKLNEESAASDEPEESAKEVESSKEKASKEKTSEKQKGDAKEIAGIFNPHASDDDIDFDTSSDYLDEDDLGGHKKGGGTNMFLVGLVIILIAILGGVVFQFTDLGDDLGALFRGELREKRQAAVRQEEEEFKAAQLAALEKYGTLNVTGSPLHSLVKLDGQIQYAPTSKGIWRALRVTSPSGKNFRNIKVKKPHTIELSSPGYKTESIDLTEGMWQGDEGSANYSKRLTLDLVAESLQNQAEMEQRMDTSDTENDYFGTVTINTIPAGATVMFDNHPLLDKKGEPMVTPVSFSEYYVKDEKTQKLEKKEVNVDTPPDVGHKIQLEIPEELGEFKPFATPVQRQMWTCEWKDGKAPDTPPKGKSFRDFCEYKFTLDMDFKGLNTYIERREAEKARVKAKNAKMKAEMAKAAGGDPEAAANPNAAAE